MNTIEFKAFMSGHIIPLEKVDDYVFSNKLMGDGFAIQPTENEIVSPIDGEIIMIFPTKHAIGIKAKDGVEILLHFGIDTVDLSGKGFKLYCEVGDILNADDRIGVMDLDFIKESGYDTSSMLCIANTSEVITEPLNQDILKGTAITCSITK